MNTRVLGSLALSLFLLTGCELFNKSAQDYVQQARTLAAEGEVQASIIEYKNALQADPEYAVARWELGLLYLRTGDGASAEKEITRAKSLNSRHANADPFPVEVPFAQALMLQGEHQRVLKEVMLEPYLGPGERYALMAMQAKAYLALSQVDKVRELGATLAQAAPQANETLLVQAYIKGVDNEAKAAVELAQQVVARDASFQAAWLYLGELQMAQAHFPEAISAFEKVIELAPYSTYAHYQLGLAAMATKDMTRANQAASAILKQSPKNPLARQLQGLIQLENREFELAQNAFEEVVKANSRYAPALYFAGVAHLAQGHLEQAVDYLGRFMDLNPNHLQARQLLATALFQQQRFQDVPRLLEPVVQAGVADAQSLQLLGSSYIQLGETDKGLGLIKRAAELNPQAAATHYQLAGGLFAAGQAEQAILSLEKTVALAPGFVEAKLMLALSHLSKGESKQAMQVAEQAIAESPDSVQAYLLKVIVLQHDKNDKEAGNLLRSLVKRFPQQAPVYLALGNFQASQGEFNAARESFKQVLSLDAKHVGVMMRLAKLERDEKNIQAMGEWLQRANNAVPNQLTPALAYAEFLLQTDESEQSLRVLGQVEEAERANVFYWSLLGQAYAATGDIAQAVTAFKKLTQLEPESTQARLALARARLMEKDKPGALKELELVLKLDPKHLPARVQKTQLLFELGQPREASYALNELLQDYPDAQSVLALQGWIALRERDFELAVKAYEQVWKMVPAPGIATEYARALMGHNQKREAVNLLESARKQYPDNSELLFVLATAYDAMNDFGKAIPVYEQVVKINPANFIALNNLAWLLKDSNPRQALRLAGQAHERAPEMPAVLDTYGLILLRQGDAIKAERYLEQASTLSDLEPSISFHYAQALIGTHKELKARRVLENVLSQSVDFPEVKEAQKLLDSLK